MARRSVRSYKSTPVPREILEKIIEAGRWAASGKYSINKLGLSLQSL